jgi:molybdopterin-binding protein
VEAIRQFLQSDRRPSPPIEESDAHPRQLEGLSARTQLRGKVVSIDGDGVLCEVVLRLGDGQEVVSVVTRNSVRRMDLKVGEEALAVIKSTEVMLYR